MSIHDRIKERREALKLSQAELARRISKLEGKDKDSPLSYQTVQQWENGKSAPTRKRRPFVAAALEMSEHDLAFGPAEPSKPDLRSSGLSNEVYAELGLYWEGLSPVFQQAVLAIAKEVAARATQATSKVVSNAKRQPDLPTHSKKPHTV